jgi:hypothetical protein
MPRSLARIVLAALLLALFAPAHVSAQTAKTAKSAKIVSITSPELTEIQEASTGRYLYLSELDPVRYPLSASPAPNQRLVFKHKGKTYNISRADVTLENEQLVIDACRTVPVTIRADARSASVKGAGEACK